MKRHDRQKLAVRIARAAYDEFATQPYVSPIDVLAGAGVIRRRALDDWRAGRIDELEPVFCQSYHSAFVGLELFGAWARAAGFVERPAPDLPSGRRIAFGQPRYAEIERADRTHWVPSQRAWMRMRRRKERAERRRREAMAAAADAPMFVYGGKEQPKRSDGRRRRTPRREPEPMSWAEWGIELYIAASERLFCLDSAGKLTGIAERDAPLLRDEHDWAAWKDWRDSPRRRPFVDTEGWERSVIAADYWGEFEVWRPPDRSDAPDDWIVGEEIGAGEGDAMDASDQPGSLGGDALTLSEADSLAGPPGAIPSEWEEWASLEPHHRVRGFFGGAEQWIDEFARAAPKRRRGSRRLRRRRRRKARRRNGGSGR